MSAVWGKEEFTQWYRHSGLVIPQKVCVSPTLVGTEWLSPFLWTKGAWLSGPAAPSHFLLWVRALTGLQLLFAGLFYYFQWLSMKAHAILSHATQNSHAGHQSQHPTVSWPHSKHPTVSWHCGKHPMVSRHHGKHPTVSLSICVDEQSPPEPGALVSAGSTSSALRVDMCAVSSPHSPGQRPCTKAWRDAGL